MWFVVDRIVPGFIWLFAVATMTAGMAFIFSKTVSRMPNRASRFVVSFLLGVPFGMAYGYSKVLLLGNTKISWTVVLILVVPVGLIIAILCTFCGSLSDDSNTH